MNAYKIGTFGHRGVGKSTYLASLYIILSQSRYKGVNIEFDENEKFLSQYLLDIVKEYDKTGNFQLPATNFFPTETRFTLSRKSKDYEITLFDYQGETTEAGKLDQKADIGDIKRDSVLDHFNKCDAIMYFYTEDIALGENQKKEGYRMQRLNDLKTLLTRLRKSSSNKKIEKPFIFVITKGDSTKNPENFQDILRVLYEYKENCKSTLISSKIAFQLAYKDPTYTFADRYADVSHFDANEDIAYPLFYLIDELDTKKKAPTHVDNAPTSEDGFFDTIKKNLGKIFASVTILFVVLYFRTASNSNVLYNTYSIGNNILLLKDIQNPSIYDTILINGIQEIGVIDSQTQKGNKWYYVNYRSMNGWISEMNTIKKEELESADKLFVNSKRAAFYYFQEDKFVKKKTSL